MSGVWVLVLVLELELQGFGNGLGVEFFWLRYVRMGFDEGSLGCRVKREPFKSFSDERHAREECVDGPGAVGDSAGGVGRAGAGARAAAVPAANAERVQEVELPAAHGGVPERAAEPDGAVRGVRADGE